jgi:predicted glycosyltransferase
MNILFDIGHPAHVHYFKYVIRNLESEGHSVFISARERYPVFELLEAYGFEFYNRGKGSDSKTGKLINIFTTDLKLLRFCKKNKIDIMVGFGSFYLSHVGFLLRKQSIILDDTDNARLSQKLYKPFATKILSPASFRNDFGSKHEKFRSFMELAYLHPSYFIPNPEIHKTLGIGKDEHYVLMRFVSWNAHHDIGHHGLTSANKIEAVRQFSAHAKIYISSEMELPRELQQYQLQIDPHQMHDVIAGASLLFGESATMASEAAMLGIPSIYIDNDGRSYTDELEEKYGIVFNFDESDIGQRKAIRKGVEILKSEMNYKPQREKILNQNIDVTTYLTETILKMI